MRSPFTLFCISLLLAASALAQMTPKGEALVLEYEVGGKAWYLRSPYPEAPDARLSGITEGIGYDNSTVRPDLIVQDWQKHLGDRNAKRLADTHPWTGRAAQANLWRVKDILVPWDSALEVFFRIDLARVDAQCRRFFPGFEELRPAAKDAIRSLVFNRGPSLNGPSRTEMREIADACPRKDYAAMSDACRRMVRVWRGTSIYRGMLRRRMAEADLFLMQ